MFNSDEPRPRLRQSLTHLHKVPSKANMRAHRTLEVHLVADLALACAYCSSLPPLPQVTKPRTQVRPLQRLVRQPHLEPSPILGLVELRDRQARPVNCDGIADVAVVQDGRRLADGQRAAACIVLDRSDRGEMLNLRATDAVNESHRHICGRHTRPVNMARGGRGIDEG